MAEVKQIWTYTLNAGTITIDATYGLSEISILMTLGTGTLQGGAILPNGTTSASVALSINQPITIGTASSAALLDNLTITTTGIVLIIGR